MCPLISPAVQSIGEKAMDQQIRHSGDPKTVREKWFHGRDDLTGEHAWSDAGQILFALLFFVVWISDSFFPGYTTQRNGIVSPLVRKSFGYIMLHSSAYLALFGW